MLKIVVVNIVLCNITLSGEGKEKGEKTTIGLISQKAILHVQHTFLVHFFAIAGLSLRAGGRGFSLATKRVAPVYFYWKIEEK